LLGRQLGVPQEVVYGTPPGNERLPAALAPLVQVRALRAERGVGPVPRVHAGFIRERSEQLVADALEQRREPFRVLLRVADTAGEPGRCLGVKTLAPADLLCPGMHPRPER
jgi:hypothetical protein